LALSFRGVGDQQLGTDLGRIASSVLDCDYEATSCTTRNEADRVAQFLNLNPGTHLLEIGSGAGWPGLYLAKTSGCDITLIDRAPEDIGRLTARAHTDQLTGSWRAEVGDAAQLPYDAGSFDAISHSDVLCCLEAKQAVLLECRRVAKPNCRMAFSVISIAPGLDAKDHARAQSNGPQLMDTNNPYPVMLATAGWQVDEYQDLSADFLSAIQRQLQTRDGWEKKWLSRIAALNDGLLKRELFMATVLQA
jgi:ubiquinone/menaquinone biosynthesis C-methylase UbiE